MIRPFFTHSLAALLICSALTNHSFANNLPNQTASQPTLATTTAPYQLLDVEIHKSPTDKAVYQAIKLPNEMEVLLISDEKANKSLFSVGISVGSMEDPLNQQGLAHYLEHMILMGSKAYPETNSLDAFLTKNGGQNNAYTAPDKTVYYLQVNHNAFDEAVARLSDAFAAPLLAESNAKKEVNAVNAEMVRAKSSDGHLIHSVNRATANPAHPFSKFSVGNHETLSDKPDSKLQDALWQFYRQYYSANRMKAVLYSNQPIEKLAQLAAQNLGKVENKQIKQPYSDLPLFTDAQRGVMIYYKPITPMKMLAVSFDLPEDKAAFKQKSGEFLSYLFSNNTSGTLSDYLVKNGLSDSGIQADYTADVSRNRGDFTLYIDLTEKGLAAKEQIISLVFQQIARLKQDGIQPSYFAELKESLNQRFTHLREEKDFDYAAQLVSQMIDYPLANIINQPYIAEKLDPQAVKAKLDLMNLDNARILLVSNSRKTELSTPYFGARYDIRKISQTERKNWLNFSGNPALNLPEPNPYFATDFALNPSDKTRLVPTNIKQQTGSQIYAMPSRYFSEEAKAKVMLEFGIARNNRQVNQLVGATLLNYMAELARQQMDFQASVAGLDADVSASEYGIVISAEGYTQHLAKLFQDYLQQFSRFELTETAFKQAKERYTDVLDAELKANAQRQSFSALANFANYPHYDLDQRRVALEKITLTDLQNLRQQLLSRHTSTRLLAVGNLSDQQLNELFSQAESVITNQNSALHFGQYLDVAKQPRKLNYIKSIPHQDNALTIAYFPAGYTETDSNARAMLLGNLLANWYFDDLRTDKQLGYSVHARAERIGKTAGISLSVQSPTASPSTIMAHNERFIQESLTRLNALSDSDFEKYRQSLLEILAQKPESLSAEFAEHRTDFLRGNANFDRKAQIIAQLKQLTKAELLDFYRNTFVAQNGLVFLSQAIGTKTDINQPAKPTGFELIESIEQIQQTFDVKNY